VRRLVLAIALAACGHAAPTAAPATSAPARRPCVHEAVEPVPASCIRASARGKLLKDDKDAGLRIWQACEGDAILAGSYVGERVGNGRNTGDQNLALLQAHRNDVMHTGAITSGYGVCGGDAGPGDDGCIQVGYQPANEDVPAVMRDLVGIFATGEDVCLPFRIDTGVSPPQLD
jgi:hypothetical protein